MTNVGMNPAKTVGIANLHLPDLSLSKFIEYLQLPTVHPNPDYAGAVTFLVKYAEELQLESQVIELHECKPIVVITWQGQNQNASTIMLNSHMDVVPVDEEKWLHPPFAAEEDDGKIYARGSQDVKVLGILHLEAIRRLKAAGFTPNRTVHVTLVPDEEIGGHLGMALFANSNQFDALNVGLVLDEGSPSPDDTIQVLYGERVPWWFKVTCKGEPGHGSGLKDDTAGEKLWRVTDKLMKFRDAQKKALNADKTSQSSLGNAISVNLTCTEGGKQVNVIPSELSATFDVRIPPNIDLAKFENQIRTWCLEAALESGGSSDSVELRFEHQATMQNITDVQSEAVASFWVGIDKAMRRHGLTPKLQVFYGATDCRYLRAKGVPSLGLTPLARTVPNLHGNDECVSVAAFFRGIKVYEDILREITMV